MKKLFLLVMAAMCTAVMWADQAMPGLHKVVRQPDGSKVKVFTHGDEFFNYETDEEGNVFERDANNALKRDSRGFLINSHKKMTAEVEAQTRKARRAPGSDGPHKVVGQIKQPPRVLVFLIQFSDTTFHFGNTDKAVWEDFFNKEGYDHNGSPGSVRDYFIAQSGGKYKPQFDVYGPITVSNTWQYYQGSDWSGNWVSDASSLLDKNKHLVYRMIKEACEQLDDEIDFSQYDVDNDGDIDYIYTIYAGYGYSSGHMGIWPHYIGDHFHEASVELKEELVNSGDMGKFDGKYFTMFSCSNEMRPDLDRTGIGTTCHETSHDLGFPDYYNSKECHDLPTSWSLMKDGSHYNNSITPPNYSIYDKYYMGWETPELLKTMDIYTLEPSKSGCCITKNGKMPEATKEDLVYYIENRQRTGWDEFLPRHGMIVWKVRYNAYQWGRNVPNVDETSCVTTLKNDTGLTYVYPEMGQSFSLFSYRMSGIKEDNEGNISFNTGMHCSFTAKPKGYAVDYSTEPIPVHIGDINQFKLYITGNTEMNFELQYKRQFGDSWEEDWTTCQWISATRARMIQGFTWETEDRTDRYKNCSKVEYRVKFTSYDNKYSYVSPIITILFRYKLKFIEANGDVGLLNEMAVPGTENILLSNHASTCYSYEVKCAQKANVSVKDGKVVLEEMPCADVTVYTRDGAVKYDVSFLDYDGSILKTQLVPCGGDATPPANPSYKGMEFLQWNGSYTDVHATTYVYAQYKAGTGHFVDIELSEHTCVDIPPFTGTDYRDKHFKGSDKMALAGDLLTFRFTQDAEDGGVVYFQSTQYFDDETGDPKFSSMTQIGKLTKEDALAKKDMFYTYDFCNNPPFCDSEKQFVNKMAFRFMYNSGGANYYTEPITFDIYYPLVLRFKKSDNITGMFSSRGKTKFFHWMDFKAEQGEYVYEWLPAAFQDTVAYLLANNAYKDITGCVDMKYLRYPIWSDVTTDVTSDGFPCIIQNGFADTIAFEKQSFHVEFSYYVKDGEGKELIIDEQTVACGESAVAPSTDETYLPFAGWFLNGKIDDEQHWLNVTEDMYFKADYVYPPDPVYYTVTFIDKDGNVIKTESVEEFDDATPPSVLPEFEGWHFIRWNAPYTYVTSDMTIRALYGQDDVYWRVNYYNWNGDWLGEEYVQDGHAAQGEGIYPYQTGHKFVGWSIMPLNEIRKDMTVTAIFDEAEVPTHKVTVLYENGTVTVQPNSVDLDKVNEGTILWLTPVPDEGCVFRGWENYDVERGVVVTEDVTVTAKFERVKAKSYTVEFFDMTGNILLKSEEVEEGKSATAPESPAVEGFVFEGWQQMSGLFELLTTEQVNALPVTEDMMYKATYKEDTGTGTESIQHSAVSIQKVLRDGRLYILVGEKMYDATGKCVTD